MVRKSIWMPSRAPLVGAYVYYTPLGAEPPHGELLGTVTGVVRTPIASDGWVVEVEWREEWPLALIERGAVRFRLSPQGDVAMVKRAPDLVQEREQVRSRSRRPQARRSVRR